MASQIRKHVLVSGACLLALSTVATAQTNPLYEHRRSASSGVSAKSFVEGSLVAHIADGRATLDTASSRLIDAGVQSGDQITIGVGTWSLLVHVAYRDELERAARYYAESQKPVPSDPGMTLVIDRENPAKPIVLKASNGDGSFYPGVHPGSRVSFGVARATRAPVRQVE